METIREANGIISPRYYQIPLDKIEAKQTMEPLAIASGVGPIVGFNIVDKTGTNILITGSGNPSVLASTIRETQKTTETKTVKLSVDGVDGTVVNAHITPSGLLSVDPVNINTGILSSSVRTQHAFIIVKAKLDYTSEIENNIENVIPPSNSNFISTLVSGWVHNGVNITSNILLDYSFKDILLALASAGVTINHGKETIIGIYEFNPPETIIEAAPEFYPYQSNILPLIPYYYIWPPKVTFTGKTSSLIQYHQERIQWILDNLSPEVDTPQIMDNAVTTPKIADNAVTSEKIADNAVTTSKLTNESVTTSKIGAESVTSEKVASSSITSEKIADNAVNEEKIIIDAVTTDKIKNGAVTSDKIADKSLMTKHFKDRLGIDALYAGLMTDGLILLELTERGGVHFRTFSINAFISEDGMGVPNSGGTGIKWGASPFSEVANLSPTSNGVCAVIQSFGERLTTSAAPSISTYAMMRVPNTNTIVMNLYISLAVPAAVSGKYLTNLNNITTTVTTSAGTTSNMSVNPQGNAMVTVGDTIYLSLAYMYDVTSFKQNRGSIKINVTL